MRPLFLAFCFVLTCPLGWGVGGLAGEKEENLSHVSCTYKDTGLIRLRPHPYELI